MQVFFILVVSSFFGFFQHLIYTISKQRSLTVKGYYGYNIFRAIYRLLYEWVAGLVVIKERFIFYSSSQVLRAVKGIYGHSFCSLFQSTYDKDAFQPFMEEDIPALALDQYEDMTIDCEDDVWHIDIKTEHGDSYKIIFRPHWIITGEVEDIYYSEVKKVCESLNHLHVSTGSDPYVMIYVTIEIESHN